MAKTTAAIAAAAGLSRAQRWAIAKAQSARILTRKPWDESEHPRVPAGSPDAGQFAGGSGGGAASAGDIRLDPKVIEVGGDEWNRGTARRLERDYQFVRPKLAELEQKAVGGTEETGDDDEENPPVYVPEEWDSLSSDDQTEAQDQYIAHYKEDYLNSEVENWQNEYAPAEAKNKVTEDFNDGSETEWAEEAIAEVLDMFEEDGKPIPFDEKQLLNAISIDYEGEGGHSPEDKATIEFDDEKLSKPEGYDPNQQTLPGIEPIEPHEMLTPDMRKEISDALLKAFDKRADDVVSDLTPPDYLGDSASESLSEGWDSMGDSDKFAFVENSTSILDKYKQDAASDDGGGITELSIDKLPDKYDPLNNTSGADYRRTQALARYLSRERSKQILGERNLAVPSDTVLRSIDNRLWKAWKESSTSMDGKLLQLATADELGGRLNAKTRAEIEPNELRAHAERSFASIGGYAGVKALTRAKWETTQYLLDKAGLDELELYRGMTLDKTLVDKVFKHAATGRDVKGHKYLPTMDVLRNGAASTTTNRDVANGWGSTGGKVTLRALVPRTAALSIPAYGINIKSEQEVVIAGTAWKGWDVWHERAPSFQDTPLQRAA
jgi:hypothetical protein